MTFSLKNSSVLCLGLVLASTLGAIADEPRAEVKAARTFVLNDGSLFTNPGEMFQHLRDRDIPDFASGNPKEIVDAYPTEFDNVGDLIDQKRRD